MGILLPTNAFPPSIQATVLKRGLLTLPVKFDKSKSTQCGFYP